MGDLLGGGVYVPLAEHLRPSIIGDVVGQSHLLGEGELLYEMLRSGRLASMILWGPPGTGKTTLARLLAESTSMRFESVSATLVGVSGLRKIFSEAEDFRGKGISSCLFVDEIHRFNKSQQDSFLPYVEDGSIVLIGATTENPGFELNSALLSRCRVMVLRRLDEVACGLLLERAELFMGRELMLSSAARDHLCIMSDGDGRYLLNMVESLYSADISESLSISGLTQFLQERVQHYDKGGDGHYGLISALHKSLRASDCDAALYWLGRMLSGGEDVRYILRRLFRFAYEDIGLADPGAAQQALVAWQYYERLGSPEGDLACGYLVCYLATAPKSNAVYSAFKGACSSARLRGSLPVPKHLVNAPNRFMEEQGFGEGYIYDHDSEAGFSGQDCFPDSMDREVYYCPEARGFERDIIKRLEYWSRLRRERGNKKL